MICDKESVVVVDKITKLSKRISASNMADHNCSRHNDKRACKVKKVEGALVKKAKKDILISLKGLGKCIRGKESKVKGMLDPKTIKRVTGEVLRALPQERK